MTRTALSILFTVTLLGGCIAQTSDPSLGNDESGDDALSASSRTYVALRADATSGYYVHDVNRVALSEKYVASLDFTGSGLDAATIADVLDAPATELLLRGKLGPINASTNTRAFIVSEAYRGMPGMLPTASAVFYHAADRDPAIECFAAPCNEEIATELNSTKTTAFTSLDPSGAAVPFADQAWLIGRGLRGGAVIAGAFVQGAQEAAGYDTVLAASQIYVRLPDETVCPDMPTPHCSSKKKATYTRDENRCVVFDACVKPGFCPQYLPGCAEGYTLSSLPAAPGGCPAFSCDPTFDP